MNNIEKVLEKLEFHIINRRTDEMWVIRLNNEIIQVNSGKRIWDKESFAKSAFVNYIKSSFTKRYIEEIGFKNGKELAHYLINTGIVKIEKL
jgi:hypothetical protein